MTTYTVTTSNWNSSSFWNSISETGSGHTLDFSALPSNFYVIYDTEAGRVQIQDGSTTYSIGDSSYSGPKDASLGGSTLFNQFAVEGGQGWNDYYGDEGDNTYVGGDDEDIVEGRGGNDNLTTQNGSDTVKGGTGDDTISSGGGNDLVQGNEGDDSIDAGSGDDVIQATDGSGHDTVHGGSGNDTIQFFGPSGVTVDFTSINAGTYTYDGNVASGQFTGLEHFDGSSADDALNFSGMGSGVTLTYTGDESGSVTDGSGTTTFTEFERVTLTDNSDYADASGASGGVILDTGAGSDTIVGSGGADSLSGGDGSDTFIINDGFGNDTINGGEGGSDSDVIDLSNLNGPVTVTYTGDEAGTITDGTDTITFSGVERLILTDLADVVDASADTAGVDIDAGLGDDTVTTGSGNDTVGGGAGADSITTGAGDDLITGGTESDTIIYGSGNDTVYGGDGGDWIDDATSDTTGSNEIYGGDGNDTVFGGTGNDTVSGGTGDDYLHADRGNDVVNGGAGQDTIFGHDGSDTIDAGSGNDQIDAGNDDDTITGGTGDDTITGGDGNDTFVYTPGDGNDSITDFNFGNTGALNDGDSTNNDFIDLSGYYDHLSELRADQADDGILNQSNTTDDNGEAVDYSDNTQFGAGSITMQGANASSYSNDNTGVDCFTSGTMIRTPTGDIPIDDLRVGDLVSTLDNGPQPIRWIGTRTIAQQALADQPNLRPVIINPGVLGNSAALLLSPQHGVMLDDNTLVRAVHLARTMTGARVAHGKRRVRYIHLMFDAHQIVFAADTPTESFYPGPMGLRMMESPARQELLSMFPELSCIRFCPTLVRQKYGGTARDFLKGKGLQEQLLVMGLSMQRPAC